MSREKRRNFLLNSDKDEGEELSREKRRNFLLSSDKEGVVEFSREKRRKRLLSVDLTKYEVLHPSFPLLP